MTTPKAKHQLSLTYDLSWHTQVPDSHFTDREKKKTAITSQIDKTNEKQGWGWGCLQCTSNFCTDMCFLVITKFGEPEI